MRKTNRQNTIEIVGDVSSTVAMEFRRKIEELSARGSPEVVFLINSMGGCVVSGLAMFMAVKEYKGRTVGKVVGAAESMAAVVLQACTERLCVKRGHILIHHIRPSYLDLLSFQTDAQETAYFTQLDTYNQIVLGVLRDRTKQSDEVIAELCDTEMRIKSQKALELNLIDLIIK